MKVLLDTICGTNATVEEMLVSVNSSVRLKIYKFQTKQKNDNPTILFVAGWITHLSSWSNVLRKMVIDFNVYYLETREKQSSVINAKVDFGVEEIGRDIQAVIEILGLQSGKFILFGSSLGATAILDSHEILTSHPICNILVAPNAVFRAPIAGMMMVRIAHPRIYLAVKPIVKWYLRTFRLDIKSDGAQYLKYSSALDSADPWKLRRAMLSLSHYEVWDKLENNKTPTLILGGKTDVLHEPENLQKMADIMPNAVYLDMETNTRTHSEEIVDEIKAFLGKIINVND